MASIIGMIVGYGILFLIIVVAVAGGIGNK